MCTEVSLLQGAGIKGFYCNFFKPSFINKVLSMLTAGEPMVDSSGRIRGRRRVIRRRKLKIKLLFLVTSLPQHCLKTCSGRLHRNFFLAHNKIFESLLMELLLIASTKKWFSN